VLQREKEIASKLTPSEARFYEYFVEHRRPVTIEALAKRYIMSTSRVSSILRNLVHWSLIEVEQVGKKKFFKLKIARSEND